MQGHEVNTEQLPGQSGELEASDLPQKKTKQTLRLKRFYMALASYALFWILGLVCYWQGFFQASFGLLSGLILSSLAVNLAFFLLFITGWNQRFKEPSLTLSQMLAAIFILMGALYFFTENIRGALLVYCYIVFMFGVFRLKVRDFLLLTVFVLGLYSVMIFLLHRFEPQRLDFRVSALHMVIIAVGLFWFSLMGGYISQLRARLANTNSQLQSALQRIEELANKDDLTGIYNRRKMIEALEYEKKLSDRGMGGFCVLLLDLDYFKDVNDEYGHLAGDEVLRVFVREIGSSLREIDLLARYGGEEFLVLLPRIGLQEALQCAQRLRQKTAQIVFPSLPSEFRLKTSIGVAEYNPVESLESTLHRMDQALYRAKERGRNRVESLQPFSRTNESMQDAG